MAPLQVGCEKEAGVLHSRKTRGTEIGKREQTDRTTECTIVKHLWIQLLIHIQQHSNDPEIEMAARPSISIQLVFVLRPM